MCPWMERVHECVSSEPSTQEGEKGVGLGISCSCVWVLTWVQVKALHPIVLLSMSGHLCRHICVHTGTCVLELSLAAGSV